MIGVTGSNRSGALIEPGPTHREEPHWTIAWSRPCPALGPDCRVLVTCLGWPTKQPSVTYVLRTMHVLDALGNSMRRAILRELRAGPRSVAEIAAGLPVSRPAVSRHLRVLEEAGLVQAKENGTRNLYSVRMQGFASVRDFVDQFWETALTRLEELSRQ
jgi:DNA-binding transcriptional ArsR family regulator